MTNFEFVFSLFSILLGLALAEVFGGLARAIGARRRLRIGWSTPLLAATLVADITIFWELLRPTAGAMPDNSAALFAGVIICGFYYFAAVLTFPRDEREETRDLDAHFDAEKSKVLACILLANVVTYASRTGLMGWAATMGRLSPTAWGEIILFMSACAVGIFVRKRKVAVCLVSVMLAMDLIDPVFALLGIGAPAPMPG